MSLPDRGAPILAIVLFLLPSAVTADPRPNTLSAREIEEGWVLLFDGQTTFGWKKDGAVTVKDGALVLDSTKDVASLESTTQFRCFRLRFDFHVQGGPPKMALHGLGYALAPLTSEPNLDWYAQTISFEPKGDAVTQALETTGKEFSVTTPRSVVTIQARTSVGVTIPADGTILRLRNIKLQPLDTRPLFNGKDLSGWKVFPGERYKSQFTVTQEGWLNVKNGPGDLQTEGQYDDFVLQLQGLANGKSLNSGIFFRCVAGQYQNGYEAQIHNGFKEGDRTKPVDFGTGAIYRRVPARQVVSNDNEWFAMTIAAHGKHLATWVNGYPTVDWTDDRPPHDNPRNGSKTGKGHISIQGHDPTTDLSFRNIRIAEMKDK